MKEKSNRLNDVAFTMKLVESLPLDRLSLKFDFGCTALVAHLTAGRLFRDFENLDITVC